MPIHIYTQPYQPWDDAEKRAEKAGYEMRFLVDDALKQYSGEGGFAVFKDGKLIARFKGAQDRLKWLHKQLEGVSG